MNEEVKQEMSARDRHIGRLRSKYPDKKFEDDEEIYGQISEDYDNYEKENAGYKEREKAISDMFANDPRSAEFLTEMSKGGNPVLSLLKHFGPDIKDTLDDPEKMQQLAEAWAADQERMARSKQLDDEYAKNMEQSLSALDTFKEQNGMSDEQMDEAFMKLITIVRDGVMGKFSPDTLDLLCKGISHDDDVALANEEGTVAGKNAKVRETLRRRSGGDGIPALGGKNGSGAPKKRSGSIFDLASEAM